MKTARFDSGLRWDDPNLRWGDPSAYLLEPGEPGYVPPILTNTKTMKTPHCPAPIITYNGNLIIAATQKYPKVAARLPAGYVAETTAALAKLPTDISSQTTAKGETGNLTATQQQNFDTLLHWMKQARQTAKLAFAGQDVKLHQEFQIGAHAARDLASELSRADILLASLQNATNLPVLKLKGWADADTLAFTAVRGTFSASTTAQQSGQSQGKTATIAKDTDATAAYDHLVTIQNAANLEFPAVNPANAPARAEFRLGIFPPDHHPAPAPEPTPAPATPKP